MAKRKRLTPANPAFMAPSADPLGASMRAPIADVAREASSTAAVEEMADTLRSARAEGRMVVSVPLEDVALDYLVRDRVGVPTEDQTALVDSLRRRGQQTPVELVDLGEGQAPRYGLISGWRRVTALQQLQHEDGARFGVVLGLLRRPEDASAAYQAMIEENEIRLGLSYYERARIALKAVEQGAYGDLQAALTGLYDAASRAKRSKIKSFTSLVAQLDGALRFPRQIGERLGLQLAQALDADGTLAERLRARLRAEAPADMEAEQSLIRAELTPPAAPPKPVAPKTTPAARPAAAIHLRSHGAHQITLEGRGVDAAFRAELEAWLKARQP